LAQHGLQGKALSWKKTLCPAPARNRDTKFLRQAAGAKERFLALDKIILPVYENGCKAVFFSEHHSPKLELMEQEYRLRPAAVTGHGQNSLNEGSFALPANAPIKLNVILWDRERQDSPGRRIQGIPGQQEIFLALSHYRERIPT